jgi:hypothetical protein
VVLAALFSSFFVMLPTYFPSLWYSTHMRTHLDKYVVNTDRYTDSTVVNTDRHTDSTVLSTVCLYSTILSSLAGKTGHPVGLDQNPSKTAHNATERV